MKTIPILFSTPMVNAILSGNKSMTRRTVKPQPIDLDDYCGENPSFIGISNGKTTVQCNALRKVITCPYGQPGDVLWVREKFSNINKPGIEPEYWYFTQTLDAEDYIKGEWKWKPGIHMPFEACRIFLRVKEIQVERLLDISEDDAKCEGVKLHERGEKYLNYLDEKYNITQFIYNCKTAAHSFRTLWLVINGNGSLISNPWVWVVSFELISDAAEIAEIRKQWYERRPK